MSSHHPAGQIEILETRIAPATIFVGSVGENDTEYKEGPGFGAIGTDTDPAFVTPFFDTDAGAADPISAVVGTGMAGPDTFYLKLTKGDAVMIASDVGYVPFITGPGGKNANGIPLPITGNLVAFFVDKDGNNEVDADELTGLALGKDVSVQISGSVDGDIVSNFNDDTFTLGGAAEAGTGLATDLLVNPIKSLIVTGNVNGRVVSGGAISQLNVVGSVYEVLTGKAAHNVNYPTNLLDPALSYDFNTFSIADGGDTLSVTPAAGVKGVNISNASVGSLDKVGTPPFPNPADPAIKLGKIEAGGGGAGAEGGSINDLTILSDTTGFLVLAGAGGNGAAGKTSGGPGGKLTKIIVNGLDENQNDDASRNDAITISGGAGGNALAGGKGGIGGAATGVYVGYELQDGKLQPSTNAVQDTVLVSGGIGGIGKTAGAGGALTTVNVIANPTAAGNDIKILGGAGGAAEAVAGSKAAKGGDLLHVDVQNPPQIAPTNAAELAAIKASKIIIQGGAGGDAMVVGAGAAGGSVTDAHMIGFSVEVHGGNGSSGVSGGAGGNLKTIVVDEGFVGSPNLPRGVRGESVLIDAGIGGSGSVKAGANGGSIGTLKLNNADFTMFAVNQTMVGAKRAADGGNSAKGAGANGGSLSDFDVVDIDSVPVPNPNNEAVMQVRAGSGGNSANGKGGNAGSLTGDNTIIAVNASLLLEGGIGGNGGTKGNGGSGGAVTGFGFFGTGDVAAMPATATVAGGKAGDGAGAGAGGAGGKLYYLSLNSDGDVNATAGAGGKAGATGAAGKGGDVSIFAGLSRTGLIAVAAGDAVAGGIKAGGGGLISNASFRASTSITVEGGDGQNGGAGGKVDGISFTNEFGDITSPAALVPIPGPVGPVTITGGAGSAMLKAAGNGGNISNVSGVIAQTGFTDIKAGTVAVVAGATKSSNGGSISDINLFGGGGLGAVVHIEAGDAPDVPAAKKGGTGGSVKDVQIGDIFNPSVIDPATIIQRIVAGDGGDVTSAKGVGGGGGSVLEIRVADDIGIRSGTAFGYDLMGGIFAGAAGASGAGGKAALAGNVIGISADGIASIVAGKLLNGQAVARRNLVEKVDAIVLNGNVASKTDPFGTYTNFGTANILGAVVDPNAVGDAYPQAHAHANTFDLIGQGAAAMDEYVDNGDMTFSFGDASNANTDGFVAAVSFFNDSATPNNVRPEAFLTVDAAGASVFIDLNNENGQPHS